MADFPDHDIPADLDAVYAQAHERLEEIRAAWFREGQPLIGVGSTGQAVEAPLVRLLRDSEAHVARLGVQLKNRGRGRPATAVVSHRIGKAPSAKVVRIRRKKA